MPRFLDQFSYSQYPTKDWLKMSEAVHLAKMIEDYWAAEGKKVTTFVFSDPRTRNGLALIRSNMRNGLPVG